eukprot:TRINITY_DN2705_c0_g1_i3.p1 TRINITY_DN2705_c0_g1~~TRINITY_DN2705_c0_g1_i3.p1  ORF type:complete len:147 (-),score=33.74 TRINITY_DN2705_c0_g1_i3:95-535(-)
MEWLQDLGATLLGNNRDERNQDSGSLLDLFSGPASSEGAAGERSQYSALLEEAYKTDLTEVENLNIFSMTASPSFGTPVIVLDGHCFPDVTDDAIARKVLLLFVRTFDPLVDIKFVVAYIHHKSHTPENSVPVSYTHLTLPTKRIV